MMSTLAQWDECLFLWLNGFHAPWLDPVMYTLTNLMVWLPLYLALTWLIFRHYGKEGFLVLAGVAVAILLADRITSGIMKPYFERLRPSHAPRLEGLVHTVNGYKGGKFGFASGHAANTIAVALFIWLALRQAFRWIWVIFVWAAIMMYTRIYLGVHYPGDIATGMAVGLLCGWIGFRFYRWIKQLRDRRQANA